MSPKSATISLPLLFLTFASLILSSAAEGNGCPRSTVPALLEHFRLPGGIFPNNVKNFSCHKTDVNSDVEEFSLKIELGKYCKVARDSGLEKIVVECQPSISAIISTGNLKQIDGVNIIVKPPFGSPPINLTVTEIKVFNFFADEELLLINSADGKNNIPFPDTVFGSEPRNCDSSSAAALDYLGSARLVPAKDNQDVPMWIYKYGRLLPLVAA